jgi:hypothetical protein
LKYSGNNPQRPNEPSAYATPGSADGTPTTARVPLTAGTRYC